MAAAHASGGKCLKELERLEPKWDVLEQFQWAVRRQNYVSAPISTGPRESSFTNRAPGFIITFHPLVPTGATSGRAVLPKVCPKLPSPGMSVQKMAWLLSAPTLSVICYMEWPVASRMAFCILI